MFFLLLIAAAVAAAGLPTCDDRPSLTTNTRSDSLPTKEARVQFLSRYLVARSPVLDAAFIIDFHDNSGLVPGPSDWNILAALQVPHGGTSAWLADAHPCDGVAEPDLDNILPAAWKVTSTPRCLCRDGNTLLVHDAEDVLVFFSSTSGH